jgi:hypothetical protein
MPVVAIRTKTPVNLEATQQARAKANNLLSSICDRVLIVYNRAAQETALFYEKADAPRKMKR